MLTVREAAHRSNQIKQSPRGETAKDQTIALQRDALLAIAAGHSMPRTLASAALVERE